MHSDTIPGENGVKPLPVRVTTVSAASPVEGEASSIGDVVMGIPNAIGAEVKVAGVVPEAEGGPAAPAKAMTQLTPSAACAAVGGQEYLTASTAALFPALSVPSAGGPRTPVSTTIEPVSTPVGDTPGKGLVVSWTGVETLGEAQLTGMATPLFTTVGWAGALLHSVSSPKANGENPDPLTLTICPWSSPVDRSRLIVGDGALPAPTDVTGMVA